MRAALIVEKNIKIQINLWFIWYITIQWCDYKLLSPTIGSNQLELRKVITFFVLSMAYSWDNRVDFVIRFMYGMYKF